MKNRTILSTFSLLAFIVSSGFSQMAVTLRHNGSTQVFYGSQPFVNAYNAASNGDTINLPGFNFSAGQPSTITKKIIIIGTGHYPDSTQATGSTIIGGFTLQSGSSKSVFEGMTINGNITFDTDIKIDSVIIRRNKVNGIINMVGTNTATECTGIQIYHNSVNYIDCSHATAAKIFNNIISTNGSNQGGVFYAKANTWIANNIISIWPYSWALYSCESVLFENNILLPYDNRAGVSTSTYYSTFKNNIFFNDPTGDTYNTWSGNYLNQSSASLLITASYGFSYTDNYHLISPSSYTGTDATQVGIYGGAHPYKEGAVPFNPHIQSKTIAPNTDVNGKLNINIKVAAQNDQ